MIPTTRTSPPATSPLLRAFRFDGLEIGWTGQAPDPAGGGSGRCDVLLALDFAGTADGTLGERLADAARRIGDNGVLLLALPNRFGLRFWSGCPEPQTGRLFATLAGPGASPRATPDATAPARTVRPYFSRRELADALTLAGLTALEWFFAVPEKGEGDDSGVLLSARLVEASPELAAELTSLQPSADRHLPRLDLFPETLVGRELARSGLFAEFADYFLVAAQASDARASSTVWARLRPTATEVAWHFASSRREPIATIFELGKDGLTVRKERLASDPTGNATGYHWSAPPIAPLAAGEPLRLRLQEHLLAGRSEAFLGEIVDLFAAIRERFPLGDRLSAEALDAIATNATRESDGAFHLFDLEWRLASGVEPSWWILRNVLACIDMRGPRIAGAATGAALYEELCQRLGVAARLDADVAQEAQLGAAVRRSTAANQAKALAAVLARPWPVPVAMGLDAAEVRSTLVLAADHQQLIADYRRLESWAGEVQQAHAAAITDYRRLELWSAEIERAHAAAIGDYRELESWATGLAAELQQRKAAS